MQAELIWEKLAQVVSADNRELMAHTDVALVLGLSALNGANQERAVMFALKGLCESAKRHEDQGDMESAIWAIAEAKYYLGALVGLKRVAEEKSNEMSEATLKREDRQNKRILHDWVEANPGLRLRNVVELRAMLKRDDLNLILDGKEVSDGTLKAWAKEAGLQFMPGRPPKNTIN
jgi:hypothetical protein